MSTENKNQEDLVAQYHEAFAAGNETFDQAEQRKKEEDAASAGRPDINYFKILKDEFGDFDIRIMPHHPESTAAGAKGYSEPVKQAWLKIAKAEGDKPINVKVFDARTCGFEDDLIVTFKYLAIGQLKEQLKVATKSKQELIQKDIDKIDSNGFNGGLRFDYKHLIWLLNMAKREEGLKLYEASNGVFKSIEEAKMTIWGKRFKKDKAAPCPISYPFGANNVILSKLKDGKKTKYKAMLDIEEGLIELEAAEIQALMDAPKLTDFAYYNKRSFEATMIFLEQYSAQYSLDVMSSEKFIEVADKIKAQLDENTEDTSSFDLNGSSSSDDSTDSEDAMEGLKFDALATEYDDLIDQEIEDGSDEMKDFRKKLRAYIKQEGSGIKIGAKKATADVLDEIEDYITDKGERGVTSGPSQEEIDEAARIKEEEAAQKAKEEEEAAAKAEEEAEAQEETTDTKEEEATPPRRRRRTADDVDGSPAPRRRRRRNE